MIYDWNIETRKNVILCDETLRDGLQSPSVSMPSLDDKIKFLHLADALDIRIIDIGYPNSSERSFNHCVALAKECANLKIKPYCAARTDIDDINSVSRVSQEAGVKLDVAMFVGSSPIRRYVEDWSVETIYKNSNHSVKHAVGQNLDVMFVTEDTMRCEPSMLNLYKEAIDSGAKTIVLCDTVGHATPEGVMNLVKYVRDEIVKDANIRIDWHGHNDRGLALANSIAAVQAGVNCVHGTALGIGERAGNTALDQLMVNLNIDGELVRLKEYVQCAAEMMNILIPFSYPVFGCDAFRTATGTHASAIIKAMEKGDDIADIVYSAVPARKFGLEQIIEIGPYSGRANVIYTLDRLGFEVTEERIQTVLSMAKLASDCLSDAKIKHVLQK